MNTWTETTRRIEKHAARIADEEFFNGDEGPVAPDFEGRSLDAVDWRTIIRQTGLTEQEFSPVEEDELQDRWEDAYFTQWETLLADDEDDIPEAEGEDDD